MENTAVWWKLHSIRKILRKILSATFFISNLLFVGLKNGILSLPPENFPKYFWDFIVSFRRNSLKRKIKFDFVFGFMFFSDFERQNSWNLKFSDRFEELISWTFSLLLLFGSLMKIFWTLAGKYAAGLSHLRFTPSEHRFEEKSCGFFFFFGLLATNLRTFDRKCQ